jgi:SAM-dependent methyltransferase
MGSLAENKAYYDNYDWTLTGEQWASRWRGTDVQWYGTILPRIHIFLPAPTILELGCGHGRLSRFLEPLCGRLVLVDMTKACIEGCRRLFRDKPSVDCLLGDGMSLAGIEDATVDFIFSFFSLVHADEATMRGYLLEVARALNSTGGAFVHHSNAGACLGGDPREDARLHDYRDAGVSAATIEARAEEVGLICRGQELFGWDTDQLPTDCFSVLVKPGSLWAKSNKIIHNRDFCSEVERLGQLAEIYGAYGYAR